MITDFRQFGLEHIISILLPCLICAMFIAAGLRKEAEGRGKNLRLLLALLIVSVRGARYIMDVFFGVFDWYDLFSLQICHIDLILLVICLIKPGEGLFNFIFLIGIPMGLAVALFPGTNHPAPGMPRAMLFIMSHMMLAAGAVYLAVVKHMKASFSFYVKFAAAGNACIVIIYFINLLLHANYLYIMEAPAGTVIKVLDNMFGWPGYVITMDALALVLMLFMLMLSRFIFALGEWRARRLQLSLKIITRL
jgi:hypothetical integral membrane protein (TIGR02206 family)